MFFENGNIRMDCADLWVPSSRCITSVSCKNMSRFFSWESNTGGLLSSKSLVTFEPLTPDPRLCTTCTISVFLYGHSSNWGKKRKKKKNGFLSMICWLGIIWDHAICKTKWIKKGRFKDDTGTAFVHLQTFNSTFQHCVFNNTGKLYWPLLWTICFSPSTEHFLQTILQNKNWYIKHFYKLFVGVWMANFLNKDHRLPIIEQYLHL